jgi:hypothetical protein
VSRYRRGDNEAAHFAQLVEIVDDISRAALSCALGARLRARDHADITAEQEQVAKDVRAPPPAADEPDSHGRR